MVEMQNTIHDLPAFNEASTSSVRQWNNTGAKKVGTPHAACASFAGKLAGCTRQKSTTIRPFRAPRLRKKDDAGWL
jgi:hypothetical protein